MGFRRIYLTAILAAAPVAAAVILGASIVSPPNVQLKSDACVGVAGVSACVDADVKVPNINGVGKVIPNVPVPNINMPNVKVPNIKVPNVKVPNVKVPKVGRR